MGGEHPGGGGAAALKQLPQDPKASRPRGPAWWGGAVRRARGGHHGGKGPGGILRGLRVLGSGRGGAAHPQSVWECMGMGYPPHP